MSSIPVFEIDVWNAWIFMLINFLPMPIFLMVQKGVAEESMKQYSEANKTVYYVQWIFWILAFAYSIFLPMRLGTMWFYVGLPIALIGTISYIIVMVSFFITPLSKEPMTTGPYRYSRNPTYITQSIMFIGVSIASASWLFLLLTMVYGGLSLIYVGSEEHTCLDKYGDAYLEYMNRTPRWIGIPKST